MTIENRLNNIVERDEQELTKLLETARALVGQEVTVTFLSRKDEVAGFNDGVNKFGPSYITIQNGHTEHIPLRVVESIRLGGNS
jgi:hypothetical protein